MGKWPTWNLTLSVASGSSHSLLPNMLVELIMPTSWFILFWSLQIFVIVRELLTNERGEQPLVIYEPVDFEKRKKPIQDFWKINDHFRGNCKIYLKISKE